MPKPHQYDEQFAGRHDAEIQQNRDRWARKPLLQEVYRGFYREIDRWRQRRANGPTVELGSGVGAIREVIPDCITTDLHGNPWIDRVESAYRMSFADGTVGNIILFDVFHHLQHPGTAIRELGRVLEPGGRLIIFDPAMSALGLMVYGALHPEPLGLLRSIAWEAPEGADTTALGYYAAQGNASRVFRRAGASALPPEWRIVHRREMSALAYVASGGYSKPQLYPTRWLPIVRRLERVADVVPILTATRLLVVLEKRA